MDPKVPNLAIQHNINKLCGSEASILKFNAIIQISCSHIAHVVKKREEGDRYIERKQSDVRKKSKVKENKKERKRNKVKENRKDRKESRKT